MLTRLRIQNFVIIDEQEILFTQGLNIVTGETGAGKSIMLGALSLVLGTRAESRVLRDMSAKAVIEATFENYPDFLDQRFADADVDISTDLIMRREILPSGKSRAFINDTPVRLEFMRSVGHVLVDLHQQFQTLEIQEQSMQFKMLDAYAGVELDMLNYTEQYRKLGVLKEKVSKLETERTRSIQERDYIEYQLEELTSVLPNEDVFNEWEEEFKLLENAESIQSVVAEGLHTIRDIDSSIINVLRNLSFKLESAGKSVESIASMAQRIDGAAVELEDVATELADLADKIEPDPQRKEELEMQLDAVQKLYLKHNVQSINELVAIMEALDARIKGWQAVSDDLELAIKERDYTTEVLLKTGSAISTKRKDKAVAFASEVNTMLRGLEMKNARFEVAVENTGEVSRYGLDKVDYLFAANKGSSLEPVGKVASGGELSRLSLCIKSVVCQTMQLPTMIFDEIDSGVSGQVALKMGDLLKELADEQQVIMITHSPQIAAKATRHLKVSKRDQQETTIADITVLEPTQRVEEIAKMLSGDPPTDAAVLNAQELINQ